MWNSRSKRRVACWASASRPDRRVIPESKRRRQRKVETPQKSRGISAGSPGVIFRPNGTAENTESRHAERHSPRFRKRSTGGRGKPSPLREKIQSQTKFEFRALFRAGGAAESVAQSA